MSEYRPRWAQHVIGTWTDAPTEGPTGDREWWIALKCEQCGDETRVLCTTGQVRSKVAAFALSHVHRDVFEVPPLKK